MDKKPLPLRAMVPATEPGEPQLKSMIAEAAYYRAEKRGFAPGLEFEDWLAAEKDIDALTRAAV